MFSFVKMVQPLYTTNLYVLDSHQNSNFPCDHVTYIYLFIYICLWQSFWQLLYIYISVKLNGFLIKLSLYKHYTFDIKQVLIQIENALWLQIFIYYNTSFRLSDYGLRRVTEEGYSLIAESSYYNK